MGKTHLIYSRLSSKASKKNERILRASPSLIRTSSKLQIPCELRLHSKICTKRNNCRQQLILLDSRVSPHNSCTLSCRWSLHLSTYTKSSLSAHTTKTMSRARKKSSCEKNVRCVFRSLIKSSYTGARTTRTIHTNCTYRYGYRIDFPF